MAEDPETGNHLEEVDGYIYCVKKGQKLTERDRAALTQFQKFLRMSPEEQRQYIIDHAGKMDTDD